MSQHFRRGFVLLFFAVNWLQSTGQEKSVDYYYRSTSKFLVSGDVDGALQRLNSGIAYFSEVDEESKAFLEYAKSSTILIYIGYDSCLRFIDSTLLEYKIAGNTPPACRGALLSIKGAALATKGNFRGALQAHEKALSDLAFEDTNLTVFNRDLFMGLNCTSMGGIYEAINKPDSSLAYYQKALPYIDTSSPNYPPLLACVAGMYSSTGQCIKANSCIDKANKAISRIASRYNIERVDYYEYLTDASYKCRYWQQTINYADSMDKYSGQSFSILLKSRKNFCYTRAAEASLHLRKPLKAKEMCKKSMLLNKAQLVFSTSFLSAAERVNTINRRVWGLDESICAIAYADEQIPEFQNHVFEYILFLKNHAFHSHELLQLKIAETKDASVQQLYDDWLKKRDEYYGSIRFDSSPSDTSLSAMQDDMLSMENRLYLKAGLISKTVDFSEEHLKRITDALEPHELAVEFVRYRDVLTQKINYGAFLVKAEGETPDFVSICEEDTLKELLIRKPLESELKYIRRVYRDPRLYSLLWAEILQEYQDAKKVYASLAGLLHTINHDALKIEGNQCFRDEVELVLVNSSKDIEQAKENSLDTRNARALIFGGLEYSFDDKGLDMGTQQQTIYGEFRGQIQGNWKYLTNTKKEADDIGKLLSKTKGEVITYEGLKGTERNFKQAISQTSPDIIHIATHGLYITPRRPEAFSLGSYSYTHSGLVMAGANTCYENQTSYTAYGDGILTAPEIATYNLRKTQLVVLSACESGLGDNSELGMSYGLHRAFKIAGAQKVIYSLWKVSDQTTKEFMTTFYGGLVRGLEVDKAFEHAQQAMRKKYDIFDWGAFQLMH